MYEYIQFRDQRSSAPLPLYFPYQLTKFKRFWGRRISTLPKWFLRKALSLSDLSAAKYTGLRAAIRYELMRRKY